MTTATRTKRRGCQHESRARFYAGLVPMGEILAHIPEGKTVREARNHLPYIMHDGTYDRTEQGYELYKSCSHCRNIFIDVFEERLSQWRKLAAPIRTNLTLTITGIGDILVAARTQRELSVEQLVNGLHTDQYAKRIDITEAQIIQWESQGYVGCEWETVLAIAEQLSVILELE